ncbi:MAG: hypothetical protein OXF09_04780 [Hyphomicrobiales bacterium]|nr:hypothetical protein [Hyphomicrobiales bacterium]
MKTLITTFAIALMVFAFNATPSYANEENNKKVKDFFDPPKKKICNVFTWDGNGNKVCTTWIYVENEIDDINDPDQAGNESEVADSGEEGSTSAAGATE